MKQWELVTHKYWSVMLTVWGNVFLRWLFDWKDWIFCPVSYFMNNMKQWELVKYNYWSENLKIAWGKCIFTVIVWLKLQNFCSVGYFMLAVSTWQIIIGMMYVYGDYFTEKAELLSCLPFYELKCHDHIMDCLFWLFGWQQINYIMIRNLWEH